MELEVERLFHDVADLSVEDRQRYFDERRLSPAARQEVEELLAYDSQSRTGLKSIVGSVANQALQQMEPKDLHCGPYRLGKLLGQGGMGAVYLGERTDDEVRQQVAVKILRPGADTLHTRQRFLAERQILAGRRLCRRCRVGRCRRQDYAPEQSEPANRKN